MPLRFQIRVPSASDGETVAPDIAHSLHRPLESLHPLGDTRLSGVGYLVNIERKVPEPRVPPLDVQGVSPLPEETRKVDRGLELHRVVDDVRGEERVLLWPELASAASERDGGFLTLPQKEADNVCKGRFLGASSFGPVRRKADLLLLRKTPHSLTKTLEPKLWKRLWIAETKF